MSTVTQTHGYHLCPGCRVETRLNDLCPDCLSERSRPATNAVPEAREKRKTTWQDVAILIALIPLFFVSMSPIAAFFCGCISLWTGWPWP